MRSSKLLLGLLTALLLCSTLSAQQTTEIKCGAILMSSTTLSADLSCPSLTDSGAALIVVGSGVELNLNGHSVSGGGKGAGIFVAGADDVTVRDGEVRGFAVGVMVTSGQPGDLAYSPQLTGLRLTGNGIGAYLVGARFAEIRDCEVSQNSSMGIIAFNATNNSVISHNLVFANARIGIVVGCEPAMLDPKGAAAACDGMHSTDNRVEFNTVMGNGWLKGAEQAGNAGIVIEFADRNVVRRNLVLANNTNPDGGQLNVTRGILMGGGTDNVIADNEVIANGRGIEVTFKPSTPVAYSTNTVVTGNNTMYNQSSGIFVGESNVGSVISDNNAIANGYAEKTGFSTQCRSGVRLQGAGASIMNNRSYDNIGYGFQVETKEIKAQFGNRAARNGADAQCSGLPCR
jgi:hypothetical protein